MSMHFYPGTATCQAESNTKTWPQMPFPWFTALAAPAFLRTRRTPCWASLRVSVLLAPSLQDAHFSTKTDMLAPSHHLGHLPRHLPWPHVSQQCPRRPEASCWSPLWLQPTPHISSGHDVNPELPYWVLLFFSCLPLHPLCTNSVSFCGGSTDANCGVTKWMGAKQVYEESTTIPQSQMGEMHRW